MKTKITLLIFLIAAMGYAQNGINYKAVVKDNLGNIIASQSVNIRFTVLEGASNVYQETHLTMTDANGIAIVNIGEGTVVSGTFSTIDWTNDNHFLKVEIDITGGTTFVNMGTTQFKSVPYAISASNIELPYFESTTHSGAAFHVHNINTEATYGIVGTTGTNGATIPENRAGVLGYSTNAHGVYGVSVNSFFAGVQGVSESSTGVGVQGYGFGGGVGGHFYTTTTGKAALTTGNGNVGIGTTSPESKLHVAGDLFIDSSLGGLIVGYPNNGDQWRFSTLNGGEDLLFRSKADGTGTLNTRFAMRQSGEFQIGDIATPIAWFHVKNNSNINKPHLLLEEVGYDYARMGFTNTTYSDSNWDIAALASNTTSNARLNFYFKNSSGAANRMVITGDGEVGINGTPTARLEIYQGGQSVGTGLRFDDGTANSDWDITHGYGLRFHYGGTLRGFINAETGAYTQSSDASLKSNIQNLNTILGRVKQLRPTTYSYKGTTSKTKTLGFIAQEVAPIFPEVVSYSEADDLYGIDYAAFGIIAIKAIQEQQVIIENQQKQIDELKLLVQSTLNK